MKLLGDLFKKKLLTTTHLEKGMEDHFEYLEDMAIDVPSAPKVMCAFLVHGTKDEYISWEFIRSMTNKHITGDKPKFVGTLLNTLFAELGADATKTWRQAGISIAQFGIQDESAFVKEHNLGKLFPSEEIGKVVAQCLETGADDAEIIAQVIKAAGELECEVDRDMSRMLVRCVLRKTVAGLGGAEELQKSEGEKLIEPKEKEELEKHKMLLKKWLYKECDQAFALFEVQKCAQDMNYPKGLCSLMYSSSIAVILACVCLNVEAWPACHATDTLI